MYALTAVHPACFAPLAGNLPEPSEWWQLLAYKCTKFTVSEGNRSVGLDDVTAIFPSYFDTRGISDVGLYHNCHPAFDCIFS